MTDNSNFDRGTTSRDDEVPTNLPNQRWPDGASHHKSKKKIYYAVMNKDGDLVDYEEYGGLAFNSKEELLFAYKDWKHLGPEVLKNNEWKSINVSITIL